MKTKYRFIRFEWVDGDFDGYWKCVNSKHGYMLGKVRWYQQWRRFTFSPEPNTELEFSDDCLDDISDFLKQCTKKKREG